MRARATTTPTKIHIMTKTKNDIKFDFVAIAIRVEILLLDEHLKKSVTTENRILQGQLFRGTFKNASNSKHPIFK